MMRRTDRETFRLPIYDGMIVLGICLLAYTLWGVHATAATAEKKATSVEVKSTDEAKKTAKLEADAKISPVKQQIATLQAKQTVVVKDAAKLESEAAELKKRFSHVQAELDMCRTSNAEKQRRFAEIRKNHARDQERISRIERLLGLSTRKE